MSYFSSKFNNREKLINRLLKIDEELYSKLENLSKNVYEASISKLVNASIKNLLETEKIQIYERKKKLMYQGLFLVRESLLNSLYDLKDKHGLSLCLLINIAVRNALIEEEDEVESN